MPGLLARIGIYLIATGIILDGSLHYFGNFEYYFPLNGTFSIFLLPLGILLILAAAFARLNSVAPGLAVFALSFIRSNRARFEVSSTADPGTSRPLRWPLRPRFTSLPSRGLISFSLAVPLIIVMWVVQLTIPQRGFWVSSMPVSRNVKPELLAGKLVLRIDIKKRLYLNSERIPAEELTQVLAFGLARHADRVVYVDGDQDLEYRDVVAVMDEIRGLHAKVILLTPTTSRHQR